MRHMTCKFKTNKSGVSQGSLNDFCGTVPCKLHHRISESNRSIPNVLRVKVEGKKRHPLQRRNPERESWTPGNYDVK